MRISTACFDACAPTTEELGHPECRRFAHMNTDGAEETVVQCGSLIISLEEFTARVNGKELPLTRKELELLFTLAAGCGKVYSREELLDRLWGIDYFGDTRTVDSHIRRLRAKLDAIPHPSWDIRTVRGAGYQFTAIDAAVSY